MSRKPGVRVKPPVTRQKLGMLSVMEDCLIGRSAPGMLRGGVGPLSLSLRRRHVAAQR